MSDGLTLDDGVSTEPHDYTEPARKWWQRRRRHCRACYLPEIAHPTGWTPARPIGDTTPPRFATPPYPPAPDRTRRQ